MERANAKRDITTILGISFVSAALYIAFDGTIMDYGRNDSHALLWRFLPVLLIQFGMSCLGILIVLIRNHERLADHGLTRNNAILSIIESLLVSIPTILFLWFTNDIHGFLPFQGMFLTLDILKTPAPLNILGYLVVAIVWGLGEGLFYVVLADKINTLKPARGILNLGALICAIIAILIHGMIGIDVKTLLEISATFILMYGSLVIRNRTGNAWGNILIFFVIWNAF